MHYIEIQSVDYDDYPIGSPTRIGPFDTTELAEEWMEKSSHFMKRNWGGSYYDWTTTRNAVGKETVNVKELTSGLITPEYYEELHSRYAK